VILFHKYIKIIFFYFLKSILISADKNNLKIKKIKIFKNG